MLDAIAPYVSDQHSAVNWRDRPTSFISIDMERVNNSRPMFMRHWVHGVTQFTMVWNNGRCARVRCGLNIAVPNVVGVYQGLGVASDSADCSATTAKKETAPAARVGVHHHSCTA